MHLAPPRMASRERNSAVLPVAQLLLQLVIGIPVKPVSYRARWPFVELPKTYPTFWKEEGRREGGGGREGGREGRRDGERVGGRERGDRGREERERGRKRERETRGGEKGRN